MSLKERFQITVPGKNEAGEGWTDFESARDTHGEHDYNNDQVTTKPDGKFNELPPGMDIESQCTYANKFGHAFNGESDVSKDDKDYLQKGFSRRRMKGTDDQYTGEHIDLFYGEAYGDSLDEVGFLERNNYLDRE